MKYLRERISYSLILVFLCFLLTSTGWLAWEYHLLEQVSPGRSDLITMVAGYLLQADGIGLFSLILRFRIQAGGRVLPAAVTAHLLCMAAAVLSPSAIVTLTAGLLMNLLCGVIAGVYLYELTARVAKEARASAFGLGYGLAVLVSWLLSVIAEGTLYYSGKVLIVCALLTAAVLLLYRRMRKTACQSETEGTQGSAMPSENRAQTALMPANHTQKRLL